MLKATPIEYGENGWKVEIMKKVMTTLNVGFENVNNQKIDENTQNLKWDVCHKFNDKLLKCQIHRYFGQKSPADILDKVLKEVSYDKRVSEWIQKKNAKVAWNLKAVFVRVKKSLFGKWYRMSPKNWPWSC